MVKSTITNRPVAFHAPGNMGLQHQNPVGAVVPLLDVPDMVAAVTGRKAATPAALANYRAELQARGMDVVDEPAAHRGAKPKVRVFATLETFHQFDNMQRAAFFANGGGLSQSHRGGHLAAPTEVAAERRMKYPVQPPEGPGWREFMAMTPTQVKAYENLTEQAHAGILARIHVFDAFSSIFRTSWRYDGASNMMDPFHTKFKKSLRHCANFGPHTESPNDPPPPVNENDPGAEFFVNMRPEAVERLKVNMRMASHGRNSRAQLKRACELAPDAVQEAMLSVWDEELTKIYPSEWIWPSNSKHGRKEWV